MRITGFVPTLALAQRFSVATPDGFVRENFTLPDPYGNPRTLRVFLPPGYSADARRKFPLLLMQDGQNLFEDETSYTKTSWKLGAAITAGVHDGSLRPVIAVGIDNAYSHEGRALDYTPWRDDEYKVGGGADQYLDWIENTVMPELERRYRLAEGRENRVISGSSIGAVASLYALVKKSALFGGAILMSGSWWWQKDSLHAWVRANTAVISGSRAWLDVGDIERGYDATVKMRDTLHETGLTEPDRLGFHIAEIPLDAQNRGHHEASWAARVHLPLRYFFGR